MDVALCAACTLVIAAKQPVISAEPAPLADVAGADGVVDAVAEGVADEVGVAVTDGVALTELLDAVAAAHVDCAAELAESAVARSAVTFCCAVANCFCS